MDAVENQRLRTLKSRELNTALGMEYVTIAVPKTEKALFQKMAAEVRAEAYLAMASGSNAKLIELLSHKRSPINLRLDVVIEALKAVKDNEDRALAVVLVEDYYKLDAALESGKKLDDLVKTRAKRVAIGFRLAAMLGE
jgi:hypothetical protein